EVILGDFLRRAFIHHDFALGVADVNEIEIALRRFGVSGVGDKLAVDATDAASAERSIPWNVADHERCTRADDGENVRIVFTIRAEQNGLDLDFVIPTLWEQRTNRAVRQPAGEDFLFRRTSFTLEVAAWELPRCSRF